MKEKYFLSITVFIRLWGHRLNYSWVQLEKILHRCEAAVNSLHCGVRMRK